MKNNSRFFFLLLYVFLTSGMQQLLAQPPVISSFIPANGQVGSLVTIKGSNLNNPTAVTIGAVNAIIISSEDRQVVAMVMPSAATGLVSVTTAGGSALGSNNFMVSTSMPPNKQLGDKLIGKSTATSSQQGSGVTISADGNTAVVGAGYGAGGVFVYTRSNNAWTQEGDKLVGSGAADGSLGADQGYSVAISADGNTIIEGGVGDNGFTGAAWIFVRDKNGVWTQQGNKLVGIGSIIVGNTTPEQGYSVSISADGNTAIVGGHRDNNYIGAAWIFTRSNNVWTQQKKLIGTGYVSIAYHQGFPTYLGVDMGTSVSMSADGNTALIGGPVDNNDTGAVWIFTRSGNTWAQQGNKLVGTSGNRSFLGGIQQGTSVAASADGNTIIIGGPFDTDGNTNNNNYGGAVWIFTRSGNTWSQQGNKLFASDAGLGAEQGWSVNISADGNTAIVGAPTDSVNTGGFWLYTRNNSAWTQSSRKLLGTGYIGGPKQGWSVNISADGNTAIIGGPEDNPFGSAWVFADTSNITLPVTLTNFNAYLFGKGIQTAWTGYNETDLGSYDVERSNNSSHFSSIANIPAKTNAALENNYSWFDASPFMGDNFYRIKAISKDGSAQYSSIVKVTAGNAQSSVQVYPNPVDGKIIHLQLNNIAAGNYIISLYNTNGETLYRKSFQHAGGNGSVTINLKNVAAGIYQIELNKNNKIYHTTIILR